MKPNLIEINYFYLVYKNEEKNKLETDMAETFHMSSVEAEHTMPYTAA